MTHSPVVPATDVPPTADELFANVWRGGAHDTYWNYRRLRETAPVFVTGSGTLVLSNYADCDAALRHRDLGKLSETPKVPGVLDEQTQALMINVRRSMIFANPPGHTRLRRAVGSAFTARHVDELSPAVGAIADRLLDKLAARPGADFVATVALPLAVHVIADLLGIPRPDRARFLRLAHGTSALVKPELDEASLNHAVAACTELREYFADLIAERRRAPRPDLLSRLAASDGPDALDDIEVIATVVVLFDAGFETTSNLLGNGLHALVTHPDQLALLRRRPELMPSAVDEMLRYEAPVQVDRRTALEPATLAGVDLAAGQVVIALLGGANRDPARFADPDRFDITRADGPGLAFASGIHFCLGAPLARMEGSAFFARLLDRFRSIEIAAEPVRRPGVARGFVNLSITLSE
jgi:cytochrome P450